MLQTLSNCVTNMFLHAPPCTNLFISSHIKLLYTGDGQNNGNTRQQRNKTVCGDCTEEQ